MSDTVFESSYEYTPVLAARLARRELRTRYGGLLIALSMGFAWAVLCLRSSTLHWLSGFLMGLVGAFALMLVRWYRSTVAAASAYSGAPISIRIHPAGIHLSSSVINSDCPWTSIAAVHRIPEGLLLIRRGSQQAVPLPHQALSSDSAAFVVAAVRAAGGRIDPGA